MAKHHRLAILCTLSVWFSIVASVPNPRCMPHTTPSGWYTVRIWSSNLLVRPSVDGYTDGSPIRVSVSCDAGYRGQPSRLTTCHNGSWSQPWPTCEILKCLAPVPPLSGRYSVSLYGTNMQEAPSTDGYRHGVTLAVRVQCNAGYRIQASQSMVWSSCLEGSWSVLWPTCEIHKCIPPTTPTGLYNVSRSDFNIWGTPTTDGYRHRVTLAVMVECNAGYRIHPSQSVLWSSCQDGVWSVPWPTCVELARCSRRNGQTNRYSVRLGNGNVTDPSGGEFRHGSQIYVTCLPGFVPEEPVRTLCNEGNWSEPWPTCVEAAPCSSHAAQWGNYSFEQVTSNGSYAHGTELSISVACDSGYYAQPRLLVNTVCRDGRWSVPWPWCEREQRPCELPDSRGVVKYFLNGDETREVHRYESVPGGSIVMARCSDPGKDRLVGDSRRLCDYGEWLGAAPRCEKVLAAVLFHGVHREVASNGTVVVFPINRPDSQLGHNLRIFCRKQFRVNGSPVLSASHMNTSQTQSDLTLDSPTALNSGNFTCTIRGRSHTVEVLITELYCPTPEIAHGNAVKTFEWIPDRFPTGQEVTFNCDIGYTLSPPTDTPYKCILGKWSRDLPVCTHD